MTKILNTADPTIVPTPTSPFAIKTPEGEQKICTVMISSQRYTRRSIYMQILKPSIHYIPLGGAT